MKCYDMGELQAYIDGELSLHMMERVSQHLDKCKVCQSKFNELIEISDYQMQLEKQELPEEEINVEVAWGTFNSKLEKRNKFSVINGGFSKMKMNNIKRLGTVAAASLLLVTGVSTVAMAGYSLFSKHVLEDNIVNKGFMREDGSVVDSTKNGTFKPLDLKITNQGITVHLTDLYVAESRVSLSYRIEDENGNLVPIEYDTEGLDLKYDGVVDGKQVDAPEVHLDKELGSFTQLQFLGSNDNLPFELMKDNKSIDIGIRELGDVNEGTITFAGFKPIDYPVILDININKIGKVEGSWKGQLELKVEQS